MTARFVGQPNLDFTMPGLSYKPEEAKKDDLPDEVFAPDPKDPKYLADQKAETKKEEPKKAVAKKAEEKKKAEEEDDVNAPPPGTTAPTKIAKLNPKKNGIRDLKLALYNLRPSPIKQVTVTCQTDKGQTSWRLDTSDSQDWPIVVRRSGTESSANLFLEPPPGDCFQKDFTINVMYEDNQNANAQAKSEAHTKSDLAVDPKAPAVAPLFVRVHLAGDEVLTGTFEGIAKDALQITTPWQDKLAIPLTRVVGVHFAPLERKESPESFAKRLKARGSEDLLLAQDQERRGRGHPGRRRRHRGRPDALPLPGPEPDAAAGAWSRAWSWRRGRSPTRPTRCDRSSCLPDGVVVSGRWKDLDTSVWKVESPWGQEMKLPAAEVTDVRFRGGRMTYLSDLRPSKVEEIPYFGRRLPWRRDVNLLGEPLKMAGQTYQRGVAVHSRSVLTYDLNGRYATFEALVGFDDASRGQGRVDCRVFADDKEIYANPDLRAERPAGQAVAVGRGGRAAPAPGGFRPRPGYRRPRDLGQRAALPARTAQAARGDQAGRGGQAGRGDDSGDQASRGGQAGPGGSGSEAGPGHDPDAQGGPGDAPGGQVCGPSGAAPGQAAVMTPGIRVGIRGWTDRCIAFSFDRSGYRSACWCSWAPRSARRASDDKDNPQSPVEVYEWSVWVGNPAQPTINTTRVYKSAMPSSVGTSRPTLEEKERTIKFAVAPISVVQFFGDACKDVDVDLRAKKGSFLSHWPPSTERAGRLQWFKSDLSADPPAGIPQSYLPENHWLHKLREKDKALYLKHESHFERFIAYDPELAVSVPVKIRGGPDEYTLQNLTGRRLVDVAVIAPTDKGYRVGWLDELPTAAPEKTDESADNKKDDTAKKGEAKAKKTDAKDRKEDSKTKKDDAEEDARAEGRGGLRRCRCRREGEEGRRGGAAAVAGGGGRERQGAGRPGPEPADRGDGRQCPAPRRARPDRRPGPDPL